MRSFTPTFIFGLLALLIGSLSLQGIEKNKSKLTPNTKEASGEQKYDFSENSDSAQKNNPSETQSEKPKKEQSRLSKKERQILKKYGAEIYKEYSSAMHRQRYMNELTPAQWKTTILFHRVRVPFTAEEQRSLEAVLVDK